MRFPTSSIAVIIAAAASPLLAQELTITAKTTSDNNPPETTTSYISPDHVRMGAGKGTETILDPKAAQMVTLDNKKKTYYVTTKEDLDKAAAKMKERMNSPEMKKMEQEMKNLPPEQRKQMEAMMGGLMGSFDVKKTGPSRKIAGYGCETWEITMGQVSTTEECLSSELQLPLQAWQMYRSWSDSLKAMMAAMGPMAKNMEQMQEKFKELKGYPMASDSKVNIMGHSSRTTSEVIEVKKGPIPASVWEIPAGYKKVDNPMLKALDSPR
jgi:hypothetical protein